MTETEITLSDEDKKAIDDFQKTVQREVIDPLVEKEMATAYNGGCEPSGDVQVVELHQPKRFKGVHLGAPAC